MTLRHGALTSVAGKRASGAVVEGDLAAAETLFSVLDRFDAAFPIVEPRRPRP